MDASLLGQLFGTDGQWSGPCTVILDAAAHVQTTGTDSIVQGGLKSFSPRLITGRVPADRVRCLPKVSALVLVQRHVIPQHTGDDLIRHSVFVVDSTHVVAVEFDRSDVLARLGIEEPVKTP